MLQPLLRNRAKSLKRMVGVGRIELPTPAMSRRCACLYMVVFRYCLPHGTRTQWPMFPFVSAPRFTANLRPLLQDPPA